MVEIGDTILQAGAAGSTSKALVSVTSRGYNLSSDDGSNHLTAIGDQINTDPRLGPLQDNGGPTPTHALLPGKPLPLTRQTQTPSPTWSATPTSAGSPAGGCPQYLLRPGR